MIDPKGLGQLGHLPDSRLAFTLPAPPAGG